MEITKKYFEELMLNLPDLECEELHADPITIEPLPGCKYDLYTIYHDEDVINDLKLILHYEFSNFYNKYNRIPSYYDMLKINIYVMYNAKEIINNNLADYHYGLKPIKAK